MGTAFWIRRTVTVYALILGVLFVVSLLKGRGLEGSLAFAAGWSAVSTTVFIATRRVRSSRGQHCALCQDTPRSVPVPEALGR